MNRNYSRLLSVAVLLAALPTFNLGASGATAVGANVSGTAPDSGRGPIVAIDGGRVRGVAVPGGFAYRALPYSPSQT